MEQYARGPCNQLHGIQLAGRIESYTKYSCIHATQSISTKSTIDLLEQDFAHFGCPHTMVTEMQQTIGQKNLKVTARSEESFISRVLLTILQQMGLQNAWHRHASKLCGSRAKPPKKAVVEFLKQYQCTPTAVGYSPSELLNKRQVRTKIDTLLPSPVHDAQNPQSKQAVKSQWS